MFHFGGFGNTAFFAPGGPGYQPPLPPAQPTPVYTGTSPTIFSTDTPALIPQVNVPPPVAPPPVYFDWQAPLDTTGFNFPDSPVSLPPISAPPLIFDWQAPLDVSGFDFPVFAPSPAVEYFPELNLEGLVFPGPVSSVPELFTPSDTVFFNWQDPLQTEGFNFPAEQAAGDGPLEAIGNFIGDVFGKIIDVGKFVIENMDIGVSYRGDFGGAGTQKAYYSTVAAPGPTIIGMPGGATPSSVRTSVTTGGGGGGGGGPAMTESERLWREATQQTQADKTKLLMYAGGAYLAYVYFS